MDLEPFDTLSFRVKARPLPTRPAPQAHPAPARPRRRPSSQSRLAAPAQGDGRKYIASLRTDAWVDMPVRTRPYPPLPTPPHPTQPTHTNGYPLRVRQGANHDLWQAFLFAPDGSWADVHVPIARFLKTWRGKARRLRAQHALPRRAGLRCRLRRGGARLSLPVVVVVSRAVVPRVTGVSAQRPRPLFETVRTAVRFRTRRCSTTTTRCARGRW